MGVDRTTRRRWLRAVAIFGLVGVAGCGGTSKGDDGSANPATAGTDVVVGPGGRLRFDPDTVTVSAGASVRWHFDSPNHNVSCRPRDSRFARLPDGADPFSSYPPDASSGSVVEAGGTFEHTFVVSGTYVYACIPHQRSGMVGRVRVE